MAVSERNPNLGNLLPSVRLIVIQGPLQLLNVISILKFKEQCDGHRNYLDLLVIGGLYNQADGENRLIKDCISIAKTWSFKLIFGPNFISKIEQNYYAGNLDFEGSIQALKRFLQIELVDVLYLARNWQFINELFLASYPAARKVCYGDGLGWLDCAPLKRSEMISEKQLFADIPDRAINPNGFVAMEEAYLMTPIELNDGLFDQCRLQSVPLEFFQASLQEAANCIAGLKEFCKILDGKKITFVLISNAAEAKIVPDLYAEIDGYLKLIEVGTQEKEFLLIKKHPRQKLNQAELLADRLRSQGYNVALIPSSLAHLPIELFTTFLSIQKVISPFSSSCIYLAYASRSEVVFGYGETLLRQCFCSEFQDGLMMSEIVMSVALQQAYSGKFHSIRFSRIQSEGIHQNPLYFASGKMQPLILAKDLVLNSSWNIESQLAWPEIVQYCSERENNCSSDRLQFLQDHNDMVMYLDSLLELDIGASPWNYSDGEELMTAETFAAYKTAARERLHLIEQLHQQAEELQLQNQQLRRKLNSVKVTAKALLRNVWRRFNLR